MSYAEFQERQERESEEELARLSLLPPSELMHRIESGKVGEHGQAFAALAATRNLALAGPFLARQLERFHDYGLRLSCAHALLNLLPYSGIPAHALADTRHRGHRVYTDDLREHLATALRRAESEPSRGTT